MGQEEVQGLAPLETVSGTVFVLLCLTNYIYVDPMDSYWLTHYLRFDSEHTFHFDIFVEEAQKDVIENVACSAGQLLATHTVSEFSGLNSGNTQEHGVPCSLFISPV